MADKMAQNRFVITLTDEQERTVREAYARYIVTEKRPLSMNKWIVRVLMSDLVPPQEDVSPQNGQEDEEWTEEDVSSAERE